MASTKPFCHSLCLLVILLFGCGACTQADNVVSGGGNEVLLSQFVDPFDWRVWVGKQQYEKLYPHIGPVKDIGKLLSNPHFFSASFNIFSRKGNATGIKLEPTRHCAVVHSNGIDKRICNNHEFNLAKLAPEPNVFDPKRRTIVIIPGYKSTENDYWPKAVRDKWLELEDVNVINAYWPDGCGGDYFTAVANSRIAARQVTMLLYYLAQLNKLDFGSLEFRRSIYIVGHSLSAHLAGAVGEELDGQVGRIMALDPAGPLFESFSPDERLDASDALLVDVIHTNAGTMDKLKAAQAFVWSAAEGLIRSNSFKSPPLDRKDLWWGINFNCGHMDYWVNGGAEQPGCSDPIHHCDHMRATDLYINALDYEIHAKRAFGPDSPLIKQGKHRLRAFLATSYEQFKAGESTSCQVDSGRRAHQGCAIPLDFVSDPEEYRSELSRQYGIAMKTDEDSERRLYFETQATEPLLADQHLLQVHVKPVDDVCKQCYLNVRAHSRANPKELYSNPAQDQVVKAAQVGDFYGLAIPFANPNNWRVSFPTPEKVSEHLGHFDEFEQESAMRLLVPERVELELDCGQPNKFVEALGLKSGENCHLEIEALELKPLAAVVDNVSSWYLSEDKNERISLKRQVALSAQARETIAELSPKGKTMATFYLSAFGVGRDV